MYILILTLLSPGVFSDQRAVTTIPGFKTEQMCKVAGEQFVDKHRSIIFKDRSFGKYQCVKAG